MWDILMATEERAKSLAGSILTSKTLRFRTEYISTQITLHKVPIYITEEHFGAFLSDYGPVMELTSIKSKLDIATSDFEVMVTLTRPKFN